MTERNRLAVVTVLGAAVVFAGGSATKAAGVACPARTCGMLSMALPGTKLLALRPIGTAGPLSAIDVRSGRRLFELPSGLASADGRSFYALSDARPQRNTPVLVRFSARTGLRFARWRLPHAAFVAAVSANGRWAVVHDARSNRRWTRLRLVEPRARRIVRDVRLRGLFEVEAISDDGRRLFLVHHHGGGSYAIRVFDVARGRLRAGSLRPKNEDEAMAGDAWTAVASPDGRWLLTLYVKQREREAFVHALDLRRAVTFCLDLPGHAGALALQQYGLALSEDGGRLFAANPTVGALAAFDLRGEDPRAVVTRRFAGRRAPRASWANAALSPDGRTLYFGTIGGLQAFDVPHGRVRGPYRVGAVAGFAFTPDGRRLTVVRVGRPPLSLDARSGRARTL
jgi:hypothetical protein